MKTVTDDSYKPGEITAKRLRMNRTVQSHALTIDLDAQYSYDNEGRMTSVTYPQSSYIDPNTLQVQQSPVTTYTYGFDSMGRPTSMTGPGADIWGNPTTVNIVNSVQFGPASELLQMSYFGATETRQYNTRLQMTHLTVPGQLNISYNFASQNNGQISSQTDNLSGEQVTYQYDALKRLYSASTSAWSQTFTYDGFGNLTDKVGTGGAPTNHSPVNAATNQLTGYSFDANGNLLTTGYGWDPQNRMSYAIMGGTQYAYDSKNKRVWTGNYTCPGGFCGPGYGWQFQSETVSFYGAGGLLLASYTPQVKYVSGNPQAIYYLLAEERAYFVSKYIGNANTTLMSGGTAIGQDYAGSVGKYFPYGEDRSSAPNDTVKFATYTRDSATGLDYADQRYYAGGSARFLSPDPNKASSGPADPGSWNRYTYVQGDPVNYSDPAGLSRVVISAIPPEQILPGCILDGIATPCAAVASAISSGGALPWDQYADWYFSVSQVPLTQEQLDKLTAQLVALQTADIKTAVHDMLAKQGVSEDVITAVLAALKSGGMDDGHYNLSGNWAEISTLLANYPNLIDLLDTAILPPPDNGHRWGDGLIDSLHDHIKDGDISFHIDTFNATFGWPYAPLGVLLHGIYDFLLGKLPGACFDPACRQLP